MRTQRSISRIQAAKKNVISPERYNADRMDFEWNEIIRATNNIFPSDWNRQITLEKHIWPRFSWISDETNCMYFMGNESMFLFLICLSYVYFLRCEQMNKWPPLARSDNIRTKWEYLNIVESASPFTFVRLSATSESDSMCEFWTQIPIEEKT